MKNKSIGQVTISLIAAALLLSSCGTSTAISNSTTTSSSTSTTETSAASNFDFSRIANPVDPTTISKHDPTEADISNLKKWIGVYNLVPTIIRMSVKDTIMESLGDTDGSEVWNTLGTFSEEAVHGISISAIVEEASGLKSSGSTQQNQIAAVVGSYFPEIEEWRYYLGDDEGYPYQPAVDLWNNGFIISQDMGGIWRLHAAEDGAIVYTIDADEILPNKAFCCIVDKSGETYWQAGIDSLDALVQKFDITGDYAMVQIIPDNTKPYPYLYPDEPWKLVEADATIPSWFDQESQDAAWAAHEEWKEIVYQFDYEKVLNPFVSSVASTQHEPTSSDIKALKEWATLYNTLHDSGSSVYASVRCSVWNAIGACIWNDVSSSIMNAWRTNHIQCSGAVVTRGIEAKLGTSLDSALRDAVGDSVAECQAVYAASYFTAVTDWEYYGTSETFPYQCGATLWEHGMIPSFDGTYWRLCSGEDATVVLELTYEMLMKSN